MAKPLPGREPTPPTNVVLVYDGGRRKPVDCRYVGIEDGLHVWEVLGPPSQYRGVKSMQVDVFPPRTTIRAEWG